MQRVRRFIVSSTQFDLERREMVRDAHIEGVLMYNNYYFKMASTDCMNVYLLLWDVSMSMHVCKMGHETNYNDE